MFSGNGQWAMGNMILSLAKLCKLKNKVKNIALRVVLHMIGIKDKKEHG